jgi:hypothetical protein
LPALVLGLIAGPVAAAVTYMTILASLVLASLERLP